MGLSAKSPQSTSSSRCALAQSPVLLIACVMSILSTCWSACALSVLSAAAHYSMCVLAQFYSGVHGIVSGSKLCLEEGTTVEESFQRGEVVECRVIKCNPSERKLRLSFNLEAQVEAAVDGLSSADHLAEIFTATVLEVCVALKHVLT